ncbi:MAG: class I SAM-dependent methyltransferase [Chloroflexi bacterium]|nr:class I SAM-dependent methyltransferase [Chloroflexota bacterium]
MKNPEKPQPRFCDYEGSNYRTAFWQGRGREYEDLVERIALRRLLPPVGERIIDIGGGFGRLVDLYRGYKEIVLMDYSRSLLEEAQQRLGTDSITYVAANLYEMPFVAGAFHAAVMVRVLHHLSDVPGALQAIHRILQPGSPFILEYANKRHLKGIIRYLLRRQQHNPFQHDPWEFAELHFNFHPAYIERCLIDAGFRIERYLCVSYFRIPFLKRLVPAPILAKVDGWLQQPTAWLKLTPSIFVYTRALGEEAASPSSSIFCCPRCGNSALAQETTTLHCTVCGARWSMAGGIYDFRQPLE